MLRRCLVTAALLVLAAAPAADASFPGRNGVVAVTLSGCGEGGHIRAYTPAGRSLHDLTPRCETVEEDEPRTTSGPEWSPDGEVLVFADDGDRGDPSPNFGAVAADGSARRPLAPALGTEPRGSATRLSFAPDGERVVFAADRKVVISRLDGTGRRVLLGGCTDANGCLYHEPRWSPDGRRVAVRKLGARPGLLVVDARTGKLVRRMMTGGVEADWSPDSRRLVFRTRYQQQEIRGGATGGNVYVQRVAGGTARRIVHRERIADTSPVWSPDGRSILFVSLRMTAGDVGFRVFPSLWRVPAGGGRPVKLTTLPETYQEEGFFDPPRLAWQPLRGGTEDR